MRRNHTFAYELKNGSTVVYRGVTQNPTVREQQHRNSGEKFTHMLVYPIPPTPGGSKADEPGLLEIYQNARGMNKLKYPKASSG